MSHMKGQEEMALSFTRGGSDETSGKKYSLQVWSDTGINCPGGGGVSTSGSVQEVLGCGPWGQRASHPPRVALLSSKNI